MTRLVRAGAHPVYTGAGFSAYKIDVYQSIEEEPEDAPRLASPTAMLGVAALVTLAAIGAALLWL
ncbi:MAG: hypothetical protein WBF53_01350, partial [Litorimonas sp.]